MKTTQRYMLGLVLLAICSLYFVVHGYQSQKLALFSFDFKPVYAGARCLIHHCDPYSESQTLQQYLGGGGDPSQILPFRAYNANYPPPGLFLAIPFAPFSWQVAHVLWLAVGSAFFILSAFLVADLCRKESPFAAVACIAIFVATSTILLMLAQPAMLTIALCIVGVWCFLRNRLPAVGVSCFAISLAFKPHIGGLIWLYFFLSGGLYRKRALQVLLATVVVCIPGFLWASLMPQSSHWMQELHTNLVGIALPGSPSDPGPTNSEASSIASLQAVVSVFQDSRSFYNDVVYAIMGTLILMWIWPVIRMASSRRKDFFALATISCFALLPIYHRQYDTRLMLLTAPALALLIAEGGAIAWLAGALSLGTYVTTSHVYDSFLSHHVIGDNPALSLAGTLFFKRHIPLSELILGIFYLACFYREWRKREAPATPVSQMPAHEHAVEVEAVHA